ncbi:ABC transporter substrate-binding protein [Arthrobacter sp. NPDC090010]|uniref:ABC transporter substrate-binding protein n=1 Tax=Arthrobacter sp. NPDC090010 TaxID=3363942 RepID=UPI003824C26C
MPPTLTPPGRRTMPRSASRLSSPSRRGFLAGGLGAAAALGLAACGQGGAQPAQSSPARTRVVDTVKGKVTVPVDPQRMVVINPQVRSTLYDLNLVPLGVYDEGAQYIPPRYRERAAAATKIGTGGEIDLEKIAALKPDLILGIDYEWNTSSYDKLTALAPTVIVPATSWQESARATAEAVGQGEALSALDKRFTTTAAELRSRYAAVLGRYRWDILQGGFDQGKFWLYGPKSDAGAILAAAGVRFAPASTGVTGPENKAVSYENVDLLGTADVIGFYANFDNTPNNNGPQLFAQTGFKGLPAVKAGRTVALPDFLPGGYGDALALLDELEAGLRALGGQS